ncbi:MAG: HAMP domain-containing protein, partial [Bryobacterales bacterium]|nr:HAMP domain-containing protein [Bryobacterales bacterium]
MKLSFHSMTAGLVVGIAGAVLTACVAGGYIYSVHHYKSLLETARLTALTQGELIRAALEHQMMENDRSLIARMIADFGREARVESVVLLDHFGMKRFSGGSREVEDLNLASPTCQACHRYPPEQRGTSRVIETRDGTILRTVIPFRNRPACHRCHNANQTINGILILDYDAGEIHAGLSKDLRWMVGGSGLIALLLVGAIGLIVRLVVLRRLQRFETVAREIAAGDLERRVPADGSDTLAWLGREFNTMADSMTGLVSEVRRQRERLETVINSIDDGIVVLDERRNVIAANDAFLQRAGQSRRQVLGQCCRDGGACNVDDCPTQACLRSG